MRKPKKILRLLIIAACIFQIPSIWNFISGDDWFHLRVSNINSFHQFFNFFSFSRNAQSIAFYRPLSTQTFFFVFQKIFGLNPAPYHIFVLFIFALSLYLFYCLGQKILGDKNNAVVAVVLLGFASSNVTRLYFLSHFQETCLVFFSLLTILAYLNHRRCWSLIFFILSLLSKETAIVLPALLFALDWSAKKVKLRNLFPFVMISTPYLYLRFFVFGAAQGNTYGWNFSLSKASNTFMWYGLWSVGAPELLLDYIGHGLRPISRFFTDFPIWWYFIIWPLIANLLFLTVLFLKKVKKIDRVFLTLSFCFVISLLPVLFLPEHKFAVELGLPLIWFSLAASWLLPKDNRTLVLFAVVFLFLNIPMTFLTARTHYSVGRAIISKKVYFYILKKYPDEPTNSFFEFVNDSTAYSKEWGSSLQISNSIQGSEMFRFLYHDPAYNVYFEDIPAETPPDKSKITLSTKQFLK